MVVGDTNRECDAGYFCELNSAIAEMCPQGTKTYDINADVTADRADATHCLKPQPTTGTIDGTTFDYT